LRLLGALACAAGITSALAQTVEVAGVKFEPTVQLDGATLLLNGAGVRTRAIFKVYAAGLYVPQKSTAAAALLAQKGPRRVTLTLLRDVSGETFAAALQEGLKNNHTEAELAMIKAQSDRLLATLASLGEAKKGDAIFFEFVPETGTRIVVNGQPRGESIAGEDFFTAVLRVWLGDKPADGDLKKGMLGG